MILILPSKNYIKKSQNLPLKYFNVKVEQEAKTGPMWPLSPSNCWATPVRILYFTSRPVRALLAQRLPWLNSYPGLHLHWLRRYCSKWWLGLCFSLLKIVWGWGMNGWLSSQSGEICCGRLLFCLLSIPRWVKTFALISRLSQSEAGVWDSRPIRGRPPATRQAEESLW